VPRVGLAAPANQELGGDVLALLDLGLGHRRLVAARRLRDDRERRRREAGEVVARLFGLDVDQLLQAPLRAQRRERRLKVGHDRAARIMQLDPLRLRHARLEAPVDEQAPDLLEGVVPDELLDVDPPVPERRAFLVGLRDLRLERDHAFEPWPEVVHGPHASASSGALLTECLHTCR
jgi:hypothetical protein